MDGDIQGSLMTFFHPLTLSLYYIRLIIGVLSNTVTTIVKQIAINFDKDVSLHLLQYPHSSNDRQWLKTGVSVHMQTNPKGVQANAEYKINKKGNHRT